LALVLAAPATAATTIGSPNLAAKPDATAGCTPACPLAVIQESLNGTQVTTPAGVIVRFRFKGDGAVSLVAYRPSERTASHLHATKVATSVPATGAGMDVVSEAATRIPVAAGDMIGLWLGGGGYAFGLSAPSETTTVWGASEGSDGSIDTPLVGRGEFLYQADVEPDADGDGFGDETQDQCTGRAGALNGCPPAPPPPAALAGVSVAKSTVKASTSGRVTLALRNPNAYAITGTLTLKHGGKLITSLKLSQSAGQTTSIALKLSKSLRASLRRAGKLSFKLRIVTLGPSGTTPSTATRTLTVRPATT
jgi:hypothetical protein